jgi:lipoprotein-releasing system ATP-binding protein
MLEACAIRKSYDSPVGSIEVLTGVDLAVESGHRVVVMGPSGSGKSTLLAILGTLEAPSSGRLTIEGEEVWGGTAPELSAGRRARFRNRTIGFIFQEHHLLGGCSAIDNVLLPVLANGSADGPMVQRAQHLLDRVGLERRASHTPAALSGGERQRVAVARALVMAPRLVLADEPTGQLDAAAGLSVADLLVDLTGESGAMLVVATHSERLAQRLCEDGRGRVLRLQDGRLEPV